MRAAFSKVTLTMFPLALGFEEIFTPYLATEGMVHVLSGGIKLVLTLMALLVSLYVPSFSYLWYDFVVAVFVLDRAATSSTHTPLVSCVCNACFLSSPASALVGIVCTMTVSVIFPALAHLKLFAGKGLPLHERLADYMLITMGLFMAVYGTIVHSA
jgi:solute carrier family 32 (vesicular inhibitory amino acid transporter)